MEKIFYNKLCRDKVPELIRGKGFDCEVREVSPEEFSREIIRKVYEEASGVTYHTSREHLLKELADLVITLEAVKRAHGISEAEMNAAVLASKEHKGAYDAHLYLAWSSDTEYASHDAGHGLDD